MIVFYAVHLIVDCFFDRVDRVEISPKTVIKPYYTISVEEEEESSSSMYNGIIVASPQFYAPMQFDCMWNYNSTIAQLVKITNIII